MVLMSWQQVCELQGKATTVWRNSHGSRFLTLQEIRRALWSIIQAGGLSTWVLCIQVGLGENASEEMLLTTAGGMMNRTAVSNIRSCSRTARGVTVANLQEGDSVQAITILRPNVED